MKRQFEVIEPGFVGSTDETDDKIKWVLADSLEQVEAAGPGCFVAELPDTFHIDDALFDFVLPEQAEEMRSHYRRPS